MEPGKFHTRASEELLKYIPLLLRAFIMRLNYCEFVINSLINCCYFFETIFELIFYSYVSGGQAYGQAE